jgi:hypothetical protein
VVAFSLDSGREKQVGRKPGTACTSQPGEGRCNPSSSLGLFDLFAQTTVLKYLRTLYYQRYSKGKRNTIKLTSFGFIMV